MPTKQGHVPMIAIPTRLPGPIVDGVDTYVARVEKTNPGLTLTRSEAVRMLLQEGLTAVGIRVSGASSKKKGAR